jgi:hypothetical protein
MSEQVLEGRPDEARPAPEDRASIWRWMVQGARSAVFLRPDWTGLRGTPLLLAGACIADYAVVVALTRLYTPGPAVFSWFALSRGWLSPVLVAWGCWLATNRKAPGETTADDAIDTPTLLTMLWMQGVVFTVVTCLAYLPMMRDIGGLHWPTGALFYMPLILQVAWTLAAQLRLALSSTTRAGHGPRAGLVATLLLAVALEVGMPMSYWYPAKPPRDAVRAPDTRDTSTAASADASGAQGEVDVAPDEAPDADHDPPMLKLTQDLFEHQQQLLATQLDAIAPQRPGVVDMYAITFAPYADVDVFMRESAVVAGVMQQRFDTRGRTLQLVNNLATTDRLPWATPLNLHRAIERVAQRMDRDDDILFIHLTSHGGADGHLAAEFFPLTVDELTPQTLRRWLDDAHIRNRVISISACYSGSWIAPLAGEDTLVMTAADADHTSYGCGSKSTLTFFGQAMYGEQLRHTWSFEQAHAAARTLIDQREKAAGKTDGYSNPQISVGSRIRERLKALQARLAASGGAAR